MTATGDTATSKLELIMGRDGLARLADSTVMVLGVGGVGSNCVEALARGGVGRLVVGDHDVVPASNINQPALAFHSTIGHKKVDVARAMVADINPAAQVEAIDEFLLAENVPTFLDAHAGGADYVVDAIDTVTSKLYLAQQCSQRGIPLVSCLGTGNRLDPSLLRWGDISQTSGCGCPLARVMRRELKKRGVQRQTVVYSVELPAKTTVGEAENGRHSPASCAFVPPAAGYLLASVGIRQLLGMIR